MGAMKACLMNEVIQNCLDQERPNIFVRGPHKLLHNSSRAGHELPVQNQRMSKHCLKNTFVQKDHNAKIYQLRLGQPAAQ